MCIRQTRGACLSCPRRPTPHGAAPCCWALFDAVLEHATHVVGARGGEVHIVVSDWQAESWGMERLNGAGTMRLAHAPQPWAIPDDWTYCPVRGTGWDKPYDREYVIFRYRRRVDPAVAPPAVAAAPQSDAAALAPTRTTPAARDSPPALTAPNSQ
jgi:hypothetical protein